jgi:RNA polymerase sigma-70 factor (ECF subfamily)
MRPSFEETFRGEYPALHRYLRRRVGAATADDLAAATFTAAYENWQKLDPERSVRPWLYGIASNLLHRHWRSERRMLRARARTGVDPIAPDESDDTAARVDAGLPALGLASALAELRPRDRELLLLSVWAELGDREIAEALDLPIGTVKSRLSRAKARLRRELDAQARPQPRPSLTRLTKEPS